MERCRANARLEGVNNVTFAKGTASHLEFNDGQFSNVLSCLTFHEVKDEKDKAEVVAEALRVLTPGGTFVFFDLFDDKSHYPFPDRIMNVVTGSGCTVRVNSPLRELMSLPYPLNDGKALKYARLLTGSKNASVNPNHS